MADKENKTSKGQYMAIGLALGLGVGAAIGNIPIGLCVGVALGAAYSAIGDKYNNTEEESLLKTFGPAT